MFPNIRIRDKLYHKYLGIVTVVSLNEDTVIISTPTKGELPFKFYDLGKVLFFEVEHSDKSYTTFDEYKKFYEIEKKTKIEKELEAERERERLLFIEEKLRIEREKQKEIERQKQRRKELEREKEEEKQEEELRRLREIHQNLLNELREMYEKNRMSNDIIAGSSSWIQKLSQQREALLKTKKEQESKIKDIIGKRKIEYLVHFTRMENLSSILEHGLVPINLQKEKQIDSKHNDRQRLDFRHDCTSCSVSFPNYKLFYKFRNYTFPESEWVLIILSTEVLFSPQNIVYFCNTNAASMMLRNSKSNELCTAKSLENMFCESIETKDNCKISRSNLRINDYYTTDPQAEVLISDIIDSKFIENVFFYERSHLYEYIKNNGIELLSKFRYKIFPEFFKHREDHAFW